MLVRRCMNLYVDQFHHELSFHAIPGRTFFGCRRICWLKDGSTTIVRATATAVIRIDFQKELVKVDLAIVDFQFVFQLRSGIRQVLPHAFGCR